MDTADYYDIAFSDHTIMNPIDEEALLEIGRHFIAAPGPALLDIGSGKGYPALMFARAFGARCTLVDSRPRWNDMARDLFAAENMSYLLLRQETDVAAVNLETGSWNVILCMGTTPVFGNIETALARLRHALHPEGVFIIGEPSIDLRPPRPYRAWIDRQGWEILDMKRVLDAVALQHLELLFCRRSTAEEWDTYMGLQWNSVIAHATHHPNDTSAREFLAWAREERELYLRYQRHYMDWNVLVLSPRRS